MTTRKKNYSFITSGYFTTEYWVLEKARDTEAFGFKNLKKPGLDNIVQSAHAPVYCCSYNNTIPVGHVQKNIQSAFYKISRKQVTRILSTVLGCWTTS